MRYVFFIVNIMFFLSSCEHSNPAFRFSNFYGTPAETLVKAIKSNDVEGIRQEVLKKHVDINFEDEEYEVSLLALAIANNKKDAFEELLRLGANPNIDNSSCVSPLKSAIRYNHNCDTFFIKKILEYGANITPRFPSKCNQAYDPIPETILHYNEESKVKCGFAILKLLTSKLNNPDLLSLYNSPEDYQENIIYNCLEDRNLSALKYLIVDLKFKVPEKIFIDGTVLLHYQGYKSLDEILKSREFSFNEPNKFREKAKDEILNYLKKE
ncbi:Ankyrin repeats (3 copies) [Mariniflexile rhizosphaerae]|uniref:hypothetical protein n=1 Tax=unclassified Mariniflexile TaxID=2643887 RepID=UPI000E33091A|nr:hypothetical protein [Mariniflexile sp. TRM1-10]AXP80828.1 Ankyrin repeats (3 copies) [Mariniflexile sp. TRM1-10]